MTLVVFRGDRQTADRQRNCDLSVRLCVRTLYIVCLYVVFFLQTTGRGMMSSGRGSMLLVFLLLD